MVSFWMPIFRPSWCEHGLPKVKAWVVAQGLDTLFISAVSFGEFRKGIVLRSPGRRREELEAWIESGVSCELAGQSGSTQLFGYFQTRKAVAWINSTDSTGR